MTNFWLFAEGRGGGGGGAKKCSKPFNRVRESAVLEATLAELSLSWGWAKVDQQSTSALEDLC